MTDVTAGPAPAAARWGMVALHGRGATAASIADLPQALGLTDIAVIAPEAPGRSWWPTSFLAPAAQMEPFVEAGLARIDAAIAAFRDAGLPPARIAVLGFSQGACLALEYAARKGAGLGAVFGLSGGLVGTGDAPGAPGPALYGHAPKRFDYVTDLRGTRVILACHAADPHIPLKRIEETAEVMARLGAGVASHVEPGPGHHLTDAGVAAIRAVLNATG